MKKSFIALTMAAVLALSVLLTACGGSTAPSEQASAKDYAQIIFDNRNAEMNEYLDIMSNGEDGGYKFMAGYSDEYDDEMKQMNGDMMLEMVGLTAEDMDQYAISMSLMMTQVYTIAIVKPAEGKDEAVQAALQNLIQTQQAAQEHYLQDQYEIAKDARLTKAADGSWVLVMTDTATEDNDAILAALK